MSRQQPIADRRRGRLAVELPDLAVRPVVVVEVGRDPGRLLGPIDERPTEDPAEAAGGPMEVLCQQRHDPAYQANRTALAVSIPRK